MPLPPQGYTSYHNHLAYCDGSGTVAEYAEAALTYGLVSLGLSCHAPVPFRTSWTMPLERLGEYIQEVATVRSTYRDLLPIATGLEVDYLHPDVASFGAAFQQEHILSLPLDYVVASTHFVGFDVDDQPWAMDESAESFHRQLTAIYHGNVQRLMHEYYARVVAMAERVSRWGLPTVVGHVDKVKMWNIEGRYFDETADWYRELVDSALDAIARTELVVELNTSGFGRPHGEPYPGRMVLERCYQRGIPVLINADAHIPGRVAHEFAQGAAVLWSVGYREVVALDDGRWVRRPLVVSASL